MNWPRISVVTPSLNQGQYLAETIEAVLSQGYPNLEYIVIDGGSTDESVDIIRRYGRHLSFWVSEPDRGQSDALNKGFACATGQYLTWINSDDVLLRGALLAVGEQVIAHPETNWISSSRQIWIDATGHIIHCAHLFDRTDILAQMGLIVVGGPSTFFAKNLFNRTAGFDLSFHYSMDTHLWHKFYDLGERCTYLKKPLMAFRFHETSKTSSEHFLLSYADRKRIRLRKQVENEVIFADSGGFRRIHLIRFIYRFRQLIVGNYFRSWLDRRRLKGMHWSQI